MRDIGRILTLAAMAALAGCGGSAQSAITGAVAAVPTLAAEASENRKSQSARAQPADCSTGIMVQLVVTSIDLGGNCAHVQLYGPSSGAGTPAAQVAGYHPADLQSAYNLPSLSRGANQTVGIVVAGDDPMAQSDLAVYRSTFSLPACTSANGCFRQISVANKVTASANWAAETAIDLDMVSAICPNCKLLVVEAASTGHADFAAAVSAAIAAGATVVNNSYVIPESNKSNDAEWTHAGIPIVAAAGDNGYTHVANWPAASSHVIAVGATTLLRAPGSRGWSETVWSRSGSACSSVAPKPSWQHDTGCAKRTVADIAAVGDPSTPVAVFNSYLDSGWVEMGGTSVAAPIVAGAYALAANGASLSGAASVYGSSSGLFRITAGSNGSCLALYLCAAMSGYNAPSGMGSPNGIGAL